MKTRLVEYHHHRNGDIEVIFFSLGNKRHEPLINPTGSSIKRLDRLFQHPQAELMADLFCYTSIIAQFPARGELK
jgi:hypothetical protein